MTEELQNMIANSKNREGLAILFDRIAERCRKPLVFANEEADEVPVEKALVDER